MVSLGKAAAALGRKLSEFDELKHEVLGLKPRAKGWRQTVGAIPDDELYRSAGKLAREWREQANKD